MADLPNGPRNVISETLAMYLGDPYELQLRTMQKFGDTFMAPTVVYGPRFVIGNPAAIKALFAAEPTTFSTALGRMGARTSSPSFCRRATKTAARSRISSCSPSC